MSFPDKIVQRAIELYQGCSAAQALKVLEREFPEQQMPHEKTIRRWRNKQRLEKHFEYMAGMSASLIIGFDEVTKHAPRGDQFDVFEYTFRADGLGQGVTREWLGFKLAANIETVCERQYSESDWSCFFIHLSLECSEIKAKGLDTVARDNPYELIEFLRMSAEKKTFKGTCPVCKDW